MTQVAGTTLPRVIPGGVAELGTVSFPGIQQILHVEQDSTYLGIADGTMRHPYTTIGAAVAAANALTPAEANRILILVWPGIYDEQVTLADDYVYLAGVDRDACVITNAAIPTLTINAQSVQVWNLTITTSAIGVGNFVVIAAPGAPYTEYSGFYECLFVRNTGKQQWVNVGESTRVKFKDCTCTTTPITAGASSLRVQDNSVALVEGCHWHGMVLPSGACTLNCVDSVLEAFYVAFAPPSISFRGCLITDDGMVPPFYITAQLGSFALVGCTLIHGGTLTTNCIFASVPITGAVIEDNVMIGGGIHQNISHVKPERIVGASGMCDWYATTQEALTSCTFDDIVVKLKRDETLVASLDPGLYKKSIDGQGKHTLSFVGGTVGNILNGYDVTLKDLNVFGRWITYGTGVLRLIDVVVVGSIVVAAVSTAASLITVTDSELTGSAAFSWALRLDDANPTIVLKRSRLKGVAGQVAIYWNTTTNNNLKIQDCAIMHGSLGANNPFGRSGAQTPNYRSTHSIYNLDPQTGAIWTNLVAAAQRFDSYDVNGDY